MAKHTQGEWGVATMDFGASDDEIYTDVDGVPVGIAQIFGPCTYSEATLDGKDEPNYLVSKEEAAANARLIAAAPDLLAALESLLLAVRSNYEDGTPKTQDQIFSEAGHEAIAAISKAKAK